MDIINNNPIGNLPTLRAITLEVSRSPNGTSRDELRSMFLQNSYPVLELEGSIGFLFFVGFLREIEDTGLILSEDREDVDECLQSEKLLFKRLVEKLGEAGLLHEFISVNAIELNIYDKHFYIKKPLIPQKFFNLRNFLIKTNIFSLVEGSDALLLVNPELEEDFTQLILHVKGQKLDFVSLESLEKSLELQKLHGAEAEKFVLRWERNRLRNHRDINSIKIISSEDVTAGFDILSFESEQSSQIDRFIEVKCYSGISRFFLTKNEFKTSVLKGNAYKIYLVDYNRIADSDYNPMIISNIETNIFGSKSWRVEVDAWVISSRNY